MTEPTPRPWVFVHNEHVFPEDSEGPEMRIDEYHIFDGRLDRASVTTNKEHARLIVAAVNCHDELVCVIKELLQDIVQGADPMSHEPGRELVRRAQSVLAKVREQESQG